MVSLQRLFPHAAPLSLSGLAGAICGRLASEHGNATEYAKAVASGVYHASVVLGAQADMASQAWAESFGHLIWLLHGRPGSYRDVGLITSLRNALHGPPPPPPPPAPPPAAPARRASRIRLPGGAWSPLRTIRITRRVRQARGAEHRGMRGPATVLTFQ